MTPEDFGKLTANVETIMKNQEVSLRKSEERDARLQKIEDQLNLYKTVIRTVRFIGLALIAIVTFKLGDVKSLWSTFVHG